MKCCHFGFVGLAFFVVITMTNCCWQTDSIDGIWMCDDPYMCFDFQEKSWNQDKGVVEKDGKMECVFLGLTWGNANWVIAIYQEDGRLSYEEEDIFLSGPRWGCRGDTLTLYGERTYVFHKIEKFPTIESLESSFKGSKVA